MANRFNDFEKVHKKKSSLHTLKKYGTLFYMEIEMKKSRLWKSPLSIKVSINFTGFVSCLT